jgi:predicted ATP-binding protein involved in virulence
MIKKIQVENYKCFSFTEIDLDSQKPNYFVGKNDQGKSTFAFEAVRLVLENGDWPVIDLREGSSKGSIKVTLTSGHSITRVRHLSKQETIISYPDGTKEHFSGKKDVSDIIQKITGINKVDFGVSDFSEVLNFFKGKTNSFVLGVRPETTQRRLVALTGADEIEKAHDSIKKELREVLDSKKQIQAQKDSLEERIKREEGFYQEIKTIFNKIVEVTQLKLNLVKWFELIDLQNSLSENLQNLLEREEALKERYYTLSNKSSLVEQTLRLIQEQLDLEKEILEVEDQLSNLPDLDNVNILVDTCPTCGQKIV